MAPRPDELPEGTDHIINGAMETGTGDGADLEAVPVGDASPGFIGAAAGDDTGGAAATGGGNDMAETKGNDGPNAAAGGTGGGGGSGAAGAGVGDQMRNQFSALRDQAGERVRGFADTGKTRASDMLEELSRVVADTADSIDERLGNNYGEYARKAADSVSGLAGSLRTREVDEIYDNVRDAVRKSPGVAIGIAAVVGFTLVRLVKAGMPGDDEGSGGRRGNGAAGGTGGEA